MNLMAEGLNDVFSFNSSILVSKKQVSNHEVWLSVTEQHLIAQVTSILRFLIFPIYLKELAVRSFRKYLLKGWD